MAAKEFNDKGWIPHIIALPDLHPEFMLLKKLYLNVSPITGKELQDKLTSAQYKMVKVINDWERSGAGRGMAVEDLEGEGVYKFIDRDDRKIFFGRETTTCIVSAAYRTDIWNTQQCSATVETGELS